MRQESDSRRIQRLIQELGSTDAPETRVYFTGGATAVLLGWRASTIDVDLRFVPENDILFRAMPRLKEKLRTNIELAWPPDFIPEVPGWQDRSLFITREGRVSFFHYDLYSQALAKIERGHARDRQDVREMIRGGWVEPERLGQLFDSIEGGLFRYPAIDPPSFRREVEKVVSESSGE